MEQAEEWEDLPPDTFKEAGTGVNVALFVLEKPVPCGCEVAPGVCSKPEKSGNQPYECATCETGTAQNVRAKARAQAGEQLTLF